MIHQKHEVAFELLRAAWSARRDHAWVALCQKASGPGSEDAGSLKAMDLDIHGFPYLQGLTGAQSYPSFYH